MPSVTLHLVLADRVLDHWRDTPSQAPFNPFDPDLANAFHQGALGPDLGYFPGGHRFLSDLSHLVRSGDLTRTLVSSAQSPCEKAFSWGWVTHVLADQAIHPLVGRGVGELLYGDREIFVDGARQQTAHVQVETGLDAFYSHLFPGMRHRKMSPVFHGTSIRFLVRAYQRVYGIPMDPTLFLASHLATVRMSVQGLVSIGVMSTALLVRPVSGPMAGARWFLQRALSAVKGGVGRESLLMAYLNPIPPAEWLMEAVGAVVESFVPRFLVHLQDGCRGLANFNLDTGMVEEPAVTHPGTRAALKALGRWAPAGLPPASRSGEETPLPPPGEEEGFGAGAGLLAPRAHHPGILPARIQL